MHRVTEEDAIQANLNPCLCNEILERQLERRMTIVYSHDGNYGNPADHVQFRSRRRLRCQSTAPLIPAEYINYKQ